MNAMITGVTTRETIPGKGERCIVGRRAAGKANGAGFGTKD